MTTQLKPLFPHHHIHLPTGKETRSFVTVTENSPSLFQKLPCPPERNPDLPSSLTGHSVVQLFWIGIFQQVLNSQLAQESLIFFVMLAFPPVAVDVYESSGDAAVRSHAWYISPVTLPLGYKMAQHIPSTTDTAPVGGKNHCQEHLQNGCTAPLCLICLLYQTPGFPPGSLDCSCPYRDN